MDGNEQTALGLRRFTPEKEFVYTLKRRLEFLEKRKKLSALTGFQPRTV
jgi:hypothetical protein